MHPAPRTRNPRGQGARLRTDIVGAARAVLVEEGLGSAITLRGIARRVGVTTPSISAHFSAPGAIVQAVVDETVRELDASIAGALGSVSDPEGRLLAGCQAYVTFGIENLNLYSLLFDRPREPGIADAERSDPFGRLVAGVAACITSGVSAASSAPATALELWAEMHGLVSLRGAREQMPWPPREVMEPGLIRAIARIHPGSATPGTRGHLPAP
jgi:AcrR family transcriptional regulator